MRVLIVGAGGQAGGILSWRDAPALVRRNPGGIEIKDRWSHQTTVDLMARMGGEVAGNITAFQDTVDGRDVYSVASLYVHPSHRRHGVARALWQAAAEEVMRRGAQLASIHRTSQWSDAFWRKQHEAGLAELVPRAGMQGADAYVTTLGQGDMFANPSVGGGRDWYFSGVDDLVASVREAEPSRRHVGPVFRKKVPGELHGDRVRWDTAGSSCVVDVPVEKINFMEGNLWNFQHAAALLQNIEQGLKPVYEVPAARLYRISKRDVRQSQRWYEDDELEYQMSMERPWEDSDAGTFYVQLLNGNHRALAALAAGEDTVPVLVGSNYREDVKRGENLIRNSGVANPNPERGTSPPVASVELTCITDEGDAVSACRSEQTRSMYGMARQVLALVDDAYLDHWSHEDGRVLYEDAYARIPLPDLERVLESFVEAGVEFDNIDLPPGVPRSVVVQLRRRFGNVSSVNRKGENLARNPGVGPREMRLGIEHELEHTDDLAESAAIACDHLKEIPDYYTRLERMERKYESESVQGNPPKKKRSSRRPVSPVKNQFPWARPDERRLAGLVEAMRAPGSPRDCLDCMSDQEIEKAMFGVSSLDGYISVAPDEIEHDPSRQGTYDEILAEVEDDPDRYDVDLPIVVNLMPDGSLELNDGHHRWVKAIEFEGSQSLLAEVQIPPGMARWMVRELLS